MAKAKSKATVAGQTVNEEKKALPVKLKSNDEDFVKITREELLILEEESSETTPPSISSCKSPISEWFSWAYAFTALSPKSVNSKDIIPDTPATGEVTAEEWVEL